MTKTRIVVLAVALAWAFSGLVASVLSVARLEAQPPAPSITFVAPFRLTVGVAAVQGTTITNVNGGVLVKAICPGETIYVGTASSVTTSTGFPMANGDTLPFAVRNLNELYFIASAASQSIAAMPFTTR